MKKTNPVLAGLAAVALSAALVPAFALATTYENEKQGETQVKYTVDQTYTWTVPTEVTFEKNSNDDVQRGTVAVTENVIQHGQVLTIFLADDNKLTLTSDKGAERHYTVSADNKGLLAGDDVLQVPAGTPAKSEELTFKLDNQAGKMEAGDYKDTLKYVASILEANSGANND